MQSIMTSIVRWLNAISDFFYGLYLDCFYATYIPQEVADWFYYLSTHTSKLAWFFSDLFSQMLTLFDEILNWTTIKGYVLSWLPDLIATLNWWLDRIYWIGQEITKWWQIASSTVQDWIAIATEGLDALEVSWSNFWNITFPEWIGKLDTLRGEWDNFWTVTLPTLISAVDLRTWWDSRLKDIQDLITTALKDWIPILESWQDWRDSVIEFFTDPEDWLYKAADRIIERFW